MNLSRLALAFLMLVPALLFIAAAETAPDAGAANAASDKSSTTAQQPAAQTQRNARDSAAVSDAMPLRTRMPSASLPGSTGADEAATSAILSAIRADPGMAGADVSVNTENGVVTLTGLVRNREQAAIASAYANRQLGVLRVDNALTIPAQ
jgi:osmotically-inducible protein OsmY